MPPYNEYVEKVFCLACCTGNFHQNHEKYSYEIIFFYIFTHKRKDPDVSNVLQCGLKIRRVNYGPMWTSGLE